jgi:hypothetical protein
MVLFSRLALFFLFAFTISFKAMGQNPIVIRAHSKSVDLRDGDLLRKGYWAITPEVRPDTYFAERFKGKKKVSFITDQDSVSFDVAPGTVHDFVIIVDGKDSAFTRISTGKPAGLSYRGRSGVADTIPFRLGFNNQILIKGKINNSKELEMLFDTGCNGLVLSDDAGVKVQVDGQVQGFGLGGSSQDDYSKRNSLQLGAMVWDSVPLTVKHQGKPGSDGVVGYNVFDGKVVELNFEQHIIIIHNKLPAKAASMKKYELRFREGLTYILLRGRIGNKVFDAWYDFDTGGSGTLMLNKETALANSLYGTMDRIGHDNLKGSGPARVPVSKLTLPQLEIGSAMLADVPIAIEDSTSAGGPPFNVLGNDLLKRFHIIIDYANDEVYLAPNSHTGDMYLYEKQRYVIWGISIAGLILATGILIVLRRRRRRKKQISNT